MAKMSINTTDRGFEALAALAEEQGLSKTQLLKQALHLYQLVVERRKNGETISFSGDKERIVEFIGPGLSMIPNQTVPEKS